MEIQLLKTYKIYAILANDMRAAKIQILHVAAVSFDKQRLIDWCAEQKAEEAYMDGKWGKTFKKDSPLEWCNTFDIEPLRHGDAGINEYWVAQEEIMNQKNRGLYFIQADLDEIKDEFDSFKLGTLG
jgi:hypothetical protein